MSKRLCFFYLISVWGGKCERKPVHEAFSIALVGTPQGSILGPINVINRRNCHWMFFLLLCAKGASRKSYSWGKNWIKICQHVLPCHTKSIWLSCVECKKRYFEEFSLAFAQLHLRAFMHDWCLNEADSQSPAGEWIMQLSPDLCWRDPHILDRTHDTHT